MTPERANEILCNPAMRRDAIKRAAAHRMLQCHPDTAVEESDLTMREVREARECLLSLIDDQENACVLCGGSGLIGPAKCLQCKGSGKRK